MTWFSMVSFVRSMALRPCLPGLHLTAGMRRRRAQWGGQMPLGEWLERYPVEFLVHTWDLAQATGQAAVLDRGLVHDALEPAREFIPVFRMSGLVGPECVVAQDANDLTRLLAIFGRRNSED
jgi:uncharacterized protein (TIGR03086 family)